MDLTVGDYVVEISLVGAFLKRFELKNENFKPKSYWLIGPVSQLASSVGLLVSSNCG